MNVPRAGSARGLLLRAQRVDRASGLRERRVEHVGGAEQARLEGTGQLGQQHLAALQVGELVYLRGGQGRTVEVPALDHEQRVRLGEVAQRLRDGDGVAVHERDRGRTDELVVE